MSVLKVSGSRRGGTLSQQITEDLLAKIRAGRFAVGHRLPTQQQLIEQYGVGHSVVRDAMQQLSAMGIVDIRPRRGAVVTSVDPGRTLDDELLAVLLNEAAVEEVFALRRIIVAELAGQAALNATDEQIVSLDKLHTQFSSARAAGLSLQDLDVRFHEGIAEAAGGSVIRHIYERLTNIMDAIRSPSIDVPGAAEAAVTEHAAILAAIRTRDADAAREAMALHSDTAARFSRQTRPNDEG